MRAEAPDDAGVPGLLKRAAIQVERDVAIRNVDPEALADVDGFVTWEDNGSARRQLRDSVGDIFFSGAG